MQSQAAQHTPDSEPARITVVMPVALRDQLEALSAVEHRTLSAQCVYLIRRALAAADHSVTEAAAHGQ